jgi:hypothetical protein
LNQWTGGASTLRVGRELGDDVVCPLPELTSTLRANPASCNLGKTRGPDLAASQLFAETMEEGLAATTNRRGNAGCCVWMSIAVYSRLLDKRWTRKLFYAVST